MKNKELFLNNESIAYDFIQEFNYPFEVLPHIEELIISLGNKLDQNYEQIKPNIWIHKTAKVSPTAYIEAPCIIDEYAEIRHNAFIRGKAIIGKHTVLGNSCEIKNSILFNKVEVPHFNYVGDSILGFHSHLGAGAITSNIKSDKLNIIIKTENETIETGMRKIGTAIGDYVEVGCNSVLNPGSMIGPNTTIYPLTSIRGIIPKNSIVKKMEEIIEKQ